MLEIKKAGIKDIDLIQQMVFRSCAKGWIFYFGSTRIIERDNRVIPKHAVSGRIFKRGPEIC